MKAIGDNEKVEGSRVADAGIAANDPDRAGALVDCGSQYGILRELGRDHRTALNEVAQVLERWKAGVIPPNPPGQRVHIGDDEKLQLAHTASPIIQGAERADVAAALFDLGCQFGQIVQTTGSIPYAFSFVGDVLVQWYGGAKPFADAEKPGSGGGDPTPVPGEHPDPAVGVLTSRDGGQTISDERGPRLILIAHMGDWLARFIYARVRDDSGQLQECRDDLADAREAGSTVIHTWARFAPHDGSPFITPKYHGLEPLDIPQFEDLLVEAIELIQSYGMRIDFGPGGIDRQTMDKEEETARLYNRAIRRARVGVFQVFAVNEPSSTHGTSDWNRGEQDVAPEHLYTLCKLMTAGTDVPWVLGHADNVDWNSGSQFCQKHYTHREQLWGAYHAYRGGDVLSKAEHRSSWTFDYMGGDIPANPREGGKKLWLDMEGCGARANQNEAPPLISNVSTTSRGEQMEHGGALALIVACATLRGAGSQMSGNGVQRFKRFRDTVGWFEIGWLIRQLPRDLHTYEHVTHGGRNPALLRATGDPHGNTYFRVDQAIKGNKVVGIGVCRGQGLRNSIGITNRMRGTILIPERKEIRSFDAAPGLLDLGDLGPNNFGVAVIAERV